MNAIFAEDPQKAESQFDEAEQDDIICEVGEKPREVVDAPIGLKQGNRGIAVKGFDDKNKYLVDCAKGDRTSGSKYSISFVLVRYRRK